MTPFCLRVKEIYKGFFLACVFLYHCFIINVTRGCIAISVPTFCNYMNALNLH